MPKIFKLNHTAMIMLHSATHFSLDSGGEEHPLGSTDLIKLKIGYDWT